MKKIIEFVKSIQSVLLLLFGKVTAKALSFCFILLVTQIYGVETVGEISLLYALVGGLAIFTSAGIPIYFLKSIAVSSDKRFIFITGNYSVILLSFIAILIFIILYFLGGSLILNRGTLNSVIFASALLIPYALVQLNQAALRAISKDRSIVIIDLIVSSVPITVLFFCSMSTYADPDNIDVRLLIIVSYIFAMGISLFLVMKHMEVKARVYVNVKNIISSIIKARSFFAISIAQFLNGYISIFLIYSLLGTEKLGIFYILSSFSGISLIILGVVNSWIAPQFAKAYDANEIEYLGSLSRKANFSAIALASPIFMGLAIFAKQLLDMYEIYSQETHLVLGAMILFQVLNLYLSSVGYLLAMSGNHRYYSKLVAISAGITGVLSFILIPLYGLLGAAIGGGVALAFWNIASFIKCKKIFGFSPAWHPGYKI